MTSSNASNGGPRPEGPRRATNPSVRSTNWEAREILLAGLEFEYQTTRNPMAVWAAWRQCRNAGDGFGLTLPAWVIAYFDAFAVRLRDWQEKGVPSDRLAEEAGNALGFKARGKDQNPITDWRNRREAEKWFYAFERHVLGGATSTAAIKKTADDVNSTPSTVRRRLEEFAKGFGLTPFGMVEARKRRRDDEEAVSEESARRGYARFEAILSGEPDPFPPPDEG